MIDMSSLKEKTIGFIGLGNMGLPMAKNILKAGYPLMVWNRTIQRTDELKQLGAKVASNPKEIAENTSVIITMLFGPSAVEEVVLGSRNNSFPLIEGITSDNILVDMTTNLPEITRDIAKAIRDEGGDMLDAPVSGSVKPATEGLLTILVGGKKETLSQVKPILETMGKKVILIGDNGAGCSMKLTLNIHLATLMASFAESFTFGVKLGLDPKTILDVFNNSALKTYISETKGQKLIDGDWSSAFSLSLMTKDLDLATEAARGIKIPIPISGATKEVYYACMANGKGDLDFSAIATQFEKMGNVRISKS
ncbi:MAG: NAD(P)-dependent oxidoreductase [Candidatus Bathyarchaeota archaeon]|nr:NAD(P)-dependent oxidoreductase [Candidatus Bathyarchaeota archaeon]